MGVNGLRRINESGRYGQIMQDDARAPGWFFKRLPRILLMFVTPVTFVHCPDGANWVQ